MINKFRNTSFIILAGLLVANSFSFLAPKTTNAADLSKFNAGNIMSDYVMSNKNSMTEAQIQAFLTSKNACTDTNIGKANQYPNMTYNIKNGRFVCLSEEVFDGEKAAKIIWQAGQDYNINPQVLIVLLQKEQGLITDTWPNHNVQYRSATGYGCPDNADCSAKYYGFKNQVRNAANFFRAHLDNKSGWYKPHVPGGQNVRYSPNESCGSGWVNIENRATSGLYSYTPYQPNRAAINAGYGNGDGCSAYGNRNFWSYFNDWFGSTQGMVYDGVDYSKVFDPEYYQSNNLDIKSTFGNNPSLLFDHFINYGMNEGRQAHKNFNVTAYMNRYPDLRWAYENNLISYFKHFALFGSTEGRTGNGASSFSPVSIYNGVDYSPVYNFQDYIKYNPDIESAFGKNNDTAALKHFVSYGMGEGRISSSTFNVISYKNANLDLRQTFGNDLIKYYSHYINWGKKEGRVATGDYHQFATTHNGVDYSPVYNFQDYIKYNPDIESAFGKNNDTAALKHFVSYGMGEGRISSSTFNINSYKNANLDLRQAFGNKLTSYYLHYINWGKKEGRVAI